MRPARNERGQVLIITAFAMIVLVAIAAIVVDLGFSWMLHRKEQNAVDPASLAAAKWIRDEPNSVLRQQKMEDEACFYAQANGFFVSDSNCNNALNVTGDLDVNYPPSSNLAGNFRGRLGFVEVIIHDTHPSFFGQVFGRPIADVRTGAVAALTDGLASSSSLVALQDVCSGGAAGTVTGGGTLRIFPASGVTAPGGYLNVDSPCGNSSDDNCTNGVGSAALDINGGSTLITPFAFVTGSCTVNGGATFQCAGGGSACLDEGATAMSDPLAGLQEPRIGDFPVPKCPKGTPQSTSATTGCKIGGNQSVGPGDGDGSGCQQIGSGGSATFDCTLNPGVYYAGWSVASKTAVHLRSGLYILAGGGISLSGSSSIDSPDSVSGSGRITIFSTDGNCPAIGAQCQGNITFTATQGFTAKATDSVSCLASVPTICDLKGILLWQDGTVDAFPSISKITLGGQASTTLTGTIYAPRGDVSINGGQNTTGCSGPITTQSCLSIQIIAWTWKIDGNAIVDMPYDPSQLYQLEQQGLVH